MLKTDRPPSFYEYLIEKKIIFFKSLESIKSHKDFIFFELCYFLLLAVMLLLFFPKQTNGFYIVVTAFLIFIGLLFFSIGKFEFSREMIKFDCKTFILLGLIFWLVLDPMFLREEIASFDGELISKVFLMILVFIIFFYLGYLIKLPQLLRGIFFGIEGDYPVDRKKLFYFVLFLLILALLPLVFWGGGIKQVIWELTHSGRFTSGWTRARMGGGLTDSFKTFFYFIQYISLFLVFYFFLTEKNNFIYSFNNKLKGVYEEKGLILNLPARLWGLLKKIGSLPMWAIERGKSFVSDSSNLRGLILVCLSFLILWVILDGGSRLNLGIILLGFIFIAFFDSFNKNKNLIYTLVVLLVILVCLMQFQMLYRNISPEEGSINYNLVKNGLIHMINKSYNLAVKYTNHLGRDIGNFSNIDRTHLKQDFGFFGEDFGHFKVYINDLEKFGFKALNLTYHKILNSFKYSRDNQFYYMLRFAENVPDNISHTNQWLILKPFYHFIPRTLWPDKPSGTVEFFYEQIDPKMASIMTVSVSIIGEFYLVQGLFGIIIIALFLGIIARQLDALKNLTKNSPAILLMYCLGLVIMFATLRSYLVFTEMLYVYVSLFISLVLIRNLDAMTNLFGAFIAPVVESINEA